MKMTRKEKKQFKETMKNIAAQQAQGLDPVSGVFKNIAEVQKTIDDIAPKKDDRVINFDVEGLREEMSWKHAIRQSFGFIVLGSILFLAEVALVGIAYTLATLVPFVLIIYMYSDRLYHPNYIHILEVKTPNDGAVSFNWFHFPTKVFNKLLLNNPANSIRTTTYGLAYLASEVTMDGNIPVGIKFAWIHFPEMQFLLKKKVYNVMKDYLNKLLELDFTLQELMDVRANAYGADMTRRRITAIGLGKGSEISEIIAEQQRLEDSIKEILQSTSALEQIAKTDGGDEDDTEESPEQPVG